MPVAARARDGPRRFRRILERGKADLVGVGERGLLPRDRAHPHALVDAEAPGLDDSLLEAPALAARILEVEIGVVEPAGKQRPEHTGKLRRLEIVRREQERLRGGKELLGSVHEMEDGDGRTGILAPDAVPPFYSPRCVRAGRLFRSFAWTAGSISATTTPGPAARSATTLPQGSTTMLWPWVSRPFGCLPPWAGASTQARFSMARARSSVSQCARPVVAVNAEGTRMMSIGASPR